MQRAGAYCYQALEIHGALGLLFLEGLFPFFHHCTIFSIVPGTDLILAHKTLCLWVISIFPIAQDAPAQLAFLEL